MKFSDEHQRRGFTIQVALPYLRQTLSLHHGPLTIIIHWQPSLSVIWDPPPAPRPPPPHGNHPPPLTTLLVSSVPTPTPPGRLNFLRPLAVCLPIRDPIYLVFYILRPLMFLCPLTHCRLGRLIHERLSSVTSIFFPFMSLISIFHYYLFALCPQAHGMNFHIFLHVENNSHLSSPPTAHLVTINTQLSTSIAIPASHFLQQPKFPENKITKACSPPLKTLPVIHHTFLPVNQTLRKTWLTTAITPTIS